MDLNFFTKELGNIWFLLFSSVILFYAIYKWFFGKASRLKSFPPGPTGLKTLKTLLKGMWQENLHEVAQEWAKEYGEVVLCRTLLTNVCFLNSARVVKEAFKGKQSELLTNDRPKSFNGKFCFYGYKDIITGGPAQKQWTLQRRLFHSALKVYGDGIERFESTVQTELDRLKERLMLRNKTTNITCQEAESYFEQLPDGRKEIKMDEVLRYSLICVLCILVTGECPSSNDPIVSAIRDNVRNFDKLISPGNDLLLTMFPFLRLLPGSKYKRICDEYTRTRNDMLHHMVLKRQANRVPGLPRGIADFLLDEKDKVGNEWLTDEHIFAVILDIIQAGTNTSLNTILSILLLLIHHPRVMNKIQTEIDEKIGQKQPHLSDRKILLYTEATILESLRYTVIVPLSPHENSKDFYIDGYLIPRKSLVLANTWFFQRDATVWEDPESFRPERFLDSDGNLLPSSHPLLYSFLPFGVGKRACPGENFALSRIFLFVTNLLQRFDFLPPIKHKLPPFSRQCWTTGGTLQVIKYYVIIKDRASNK